MPLETITVSDYQKLMGLSPELTDNELTWATADQWRWEVWRKGICPQSTATRAIHRRLEAAGVEEVRARGATKDALASLLELGELSKVSASGNAHLAPVQPQTIELSPETHALVGSLPTRLLPDSVRPVGFTRHFSADDVETRTKLAQLGVSPWPAQNWVGSQRFTWAPRSTPTGPSPSPKDAWSSLVERLRSSAAPVSDPSSYEVVAGEPGGFLGRAFQEGQRRWQAPTEVGVWLGRRKGYEQTGMTNPCMVFVGNQGELTACDLFDNSELDWAFVMRGAALGCPEVVNVSIREGAEATLQCTFPPPHQVRRVLSLCGHECGPWKWSLPLDTLTIAERLLGDLHIKTNHLS